MEAAWQQRLSDQMAKFQSNMHMGDGLPFADHAALGLNVFGDTCKLSSLHPHRQLLQLLQQHIALSPTLAHSWKRYADLESIGNWTTTSALDGFEFTACIGTIWDQYNDTAQFVNGGFWSTPYTWQDVWRRTFRVDTVIGLPQQATAAARAVAVVPAEKLLGCLPTMDWVFASPQPCRAL